MTSRPLSQDQLSATGFAPKLRSDLSYARGKTPASVLVTDLASGALHNFHEAEWAVAMRMDGTHNLDWLFEQAQARYQSLTKPQFQHFVMHLARLGLLANAAPSVESETGEFGEETAVDPGLTRNWVVAEQYESRDDSHVVEAELENAGDDVHTDGSGIVLEFRRPNPGFESNTERLRIREDSDQKIPTYIEPSEVVDNSLDAPMSPADNMQWEERRSASIADRRIDFQQSELENTQPPIVALELRIPTGEMPRPGEPAPLVLGSEDEPQPVADPQVPTSTPESTDGAAERSEPSALIPQQPPWYLRPAYRMLRAPAALSVVTVALALIPYPRYVTDECSVLPHARAEVRAQVDGILATIAVDEGQTVKAGDVLAELDAREHDAALQQAKAELQSLSAKLEKIRSGFRPEEIAKVEAAVRARARDVDFARNEAQRRQRLLSQGVGSAEARDNAQRDFEVMRASLSQAQAELRLMRAGYRQEEVKVAEAELRGAESRVAFLTKRREQLTITSPIDGQVTTPKFREHLHKKVTAGDTVCEVANTTQVRVEIMVPEQEIDLVKVGQSTVVKVRSLPLHPFEGKVTFIAPAVEVQGEKRFVRSVTVIENPDGMLHEGMSGYAEIDTGRSTLLRLMLRRIVRWVRVRFLI